MKIGSKTYKISFEGYTFNSANNLYVAQGALAVLGSAMAMLQWGPNEVRKRPVSSWFEAGGPRPEKPSDFKLTLKYLKDIYK